ncbi:MAG: hypothetical protein U0166_06110 [Acidobacteriota bacterium]
MLIPKTLTLSCAMTLLSLSIPRAAHATEGAASIDALMTQVTDAAAAGRSGDVLLLLHPDDRPLYGFAMMIRGSFTPLAFGDDEKKAAAIAKEWDALLLKHNVAHGPTGAPAAGSADDMKSRARELFKNTDVTAFVADAVAFTKKYKKPGHERADVPAPLGKLSDLKVDGDTATGTIEGKPQRFSKLDGRWYLRLDM